MRREPRYVRFRGRWMRLHEAVALAGLRLNLVWMRLDRGWPPDRALETPARPRVPKRVRPTVAVTDC